ncbi:hypothetical protein B0O99DRAFT_599721 [Bisporella sp. PMI_857]|nr:hypothetical protein B0O99DRAFT_599721 [Bisporella sp. PMI_857]
MPQLSYFQYVQGLVGDFPWLQLVVDFMSPHIRIKGYHEDEHVMQRMRKVDVNVIDLGPSSAKPTPFNDASSLSDHLDSKQESGSIRVILVESISADVIELLGKKFSLDPRFFEDHLRGIHEFLADRWEGDKTERLEYSMSEILHRDFLTLRFSRPYLFEGWDDIWASRVKLNVPRRGNRVRSLFLREYASVYGPIQNHKDCFSFIVICDPLLDNRIPDELYLRNNEPMPRYDPQPHLALSCTKRKHISTRSTLEKALLSSQTQSCSDTRSILIHTILATALDFHAAAIYELSLSRYRLDSTYTSRPKESYKSIFLPQGEARQLLEMEVQSLEAAHTEVRQLQAQILEFLRQEQELGFTHSVERLTTISFLFLPFSTIATILSIQDTLRFSVFAGIALPVFVICIVIGIRGASVADILIVINHRVRDFCSTCAFYLRALLLLNRTKKTDKELDVESKSEPIKRVILFKR